MPQTQHNLFPMIDMDDQLKAIDAGMLATLSIGKVLYKGTYHNWESNNKPEFKQDGPKHYSPRKLDYVTTSTPYVWVDDGTDGPYTIEPKTEPALNFTVGGSPKTFKGSLMSTSGSFGSTWVNLQQVTHPGIEAREFSEEIAKLLEPILADNVQAEIDKVF